MKLAAVAMLLLACAPLGAQAPTAPDSSRRSAFQFRFAFDFRYAFNPDWVLSQGRSVNLEKAQDDRIRAEMDLATAGFPAIREQLVAQQRELDRLLAMPRVNEAVAMRTLDAVLRLESELKRLQLKLLIRTKNVLTPEQQQLLLGMGRTDQ